MTNRAAEVPGLLVPVVERNPEAEEALLLLGKAYLKTGRSREGLPYLEKVVSLPTIAEPRNVLEAHYWLGLVADLRGRREDALSHYAETQRISREIGMEDFGREGDAFSRMAASGLAGPLRVNRVGRVVATAPANDASPQSTGGGVAAEKVQDWVQRLEGKPLSKITVLGAGRTRESLILAQLPFRLGEAYSSKKAALGRARLEELDIFDDRMYKVNIVAMPSGSAKGTGDSDQEPAGVEVVVRIAEAGLLYKDPIEFAAVSGQNLMEGRVEQTFRNISGAGVNLTGALVGMAAAGGRWAHRAP